MRNKTRCNITRHEPKGRRPTYQANQGLAKWRKKPKTRSKHAPNSTNHAGVAHAVLEVYTMKIGPKRHLQGMATPLVRPYPYGCVSGTSLVGYLSPSYQCRLSRCRPGLVHLEWRFGAFMKGSSIFQRINPSSPPIKGVLPLLISSHTTKEQLFTIF